MSTDLTDPIFHDENKAREHFEAIRWPNGPYCPHCGNADEARIAKLTSEKHRPGLFQCRECREQFTVTIGSVMERSHVPLTKWALAFHLMASSKKGISAHQLWRTLGLGSYRTAWFMAHRVREAMGLPVPKEGLGGANKVVEADETFVGGKAKNRAYRKPAPKKAVMTLVERDGSAKSRHVSDIGGDTLREAMVTVASRKSWLMTDEAPQYVSIGKEFAGHGTVNHSADEYVKLGGFTHTNTAENYFSILKRGIYGVYHHVSEAHLHRYLTEFDFRYSKRIGLGIDDTARAIAAIKGAEGKRLMYNQPRQAQI